ncbi:MAG TPA: TetR family transcriptional regulator [Trebonia sp.]|nr:TetR family transcriptional regulator [Trebonia sp.]
MTATPAEGGNSRGRPPRVSREETIDAALRVARRAGLPGVTMTALAEELGVSPMASYYHIASKQELLELVVDAVLAGVRVPTAAEGDWKTRMTILLGSARQELGQVRGIGDVIRQRGATPQAARLAGSVVEILRDAGFGAEQATLAFDAIYT